MAWNSLNNITAPDQYTTASTLDGLPQLSHVNIDVSNSSIFWSLKQIAGLSGNEGLATWQPEVFMPPGSRSLFRSGIVGVRIRAAVPAASLPAGGLQAQVTVEPV